MKAFLETNYKNLKNKQKKLWKLPKKLQKTF